MGAHLHLHFFFALLDDVETWSDARQRKRRLAEEVWIAEHVDVLHDEPQQRHRRIDDIKLARLGPDRIETIIHWKNRQHHSRFTSHLPSRVSEYGRKKERKVDLYSAYRQFLDH